MNTFKTTACILSLATAGFAMDDGGTPPHTPPRAGEQHISVITPVGLDFGELHIDTPVHVQPQHGFVTPQDQMIQQTTPQRPVALARLRLNAVTPDAAVRLRFAVTPDLDRLVGSVTSSPLLTNKRKSIEAATILDPKGNVLFTTAKKKRKGSSSTFGSKSPMSITDMTRLETDAFTPAVHPSMRQFTTGKNMRWVGEEDPNLIDVRDAYLPAQEESIQEDTSVVANDENEAVQDDSMGSFIIHGAGLLGNDLSQDDSMGSFIIHGAGLLDAADQDDDSMSVISYAGSQEDHNLDMGDDEIDLSDEE